MKTVVLLFFFSGLAFSEVSITAFYRCSNGSSGSVSGSGSSIDIAREYARSLARARCEGRLDFIRFVET